MLTFIIIISIIKQGDKMDYDRLRDNLNMIMAQKPYIYKILTGGNPIEFTPDNMDDNEAIENFANGSLGGNIRKWSDMSQEERRSLLTNLYAALPETDEYAEQAIVADMILTRIGAPGYEKAKPHEANEWLDQPYLTSRKFQNQGGINFEQTEQDLLVAHNINNETPSPITKAITDFDLDRLESLLNYDPDLNLKDENGETPLITAARVSNPKAIELCLEHGADANVQDGNGNIPLMIALQQKSQMSVGELIEASDLNHRNAEGETSITLAIKNDAPIYTIETMLPDIDYTITSPQLIESLLQDYSSRHPERKHRIDGQISNISINGPRQIRQIQNEQFKKLLNFMNEDNTEEALKLIKENPYLVTISDNEDKTALMYAAFHGNTEIVQTLINAENININAKDKNGDTALTHAAINGKTKTVQALISANGIDINAQNKNGDTALMCAAYSGHFDTIKALIDTKGININAINKHEKTALDLVPPENKELIDFMRSKGALTVEELKNKEKQNEEPTPEPEKIAVIRHQYGANKEEHEKSVNHAKNRINRSGKSRIARRQRAALSGQVGMDKAVENALANIRKMEEQGLLPKGPGGQSNAEVYLYRLQQARLFYAPTERLQMSDGSSQQADKALGTEDMPFRQAYATLISNKIEEATQLQQLARTVQITEGCINNKGQARTKPIIPVQGMSYAPGTDRNVSSLKERIESNSEQNVTKENDLYQSLAISSSMTDRGMV